MEEIENVNVSTTNLTVNTKLRFRVHGVRNLLDRWAIGRIVWKREDVDWEDCMETRRRRNRSDHFILQLEQLHGTIVWKPGFI